MFSHRGGGDDGDDDNDDDDDFVGDDAEEKDLTIWREINAWFPFRSNLVCIYFCKGADQTT